MILAVNDLSKSFGITPIVEHASFHIEEHEKCAIVGMNGAGKSTLLKMIIGEVSADSGIVTTAKDARIGYLAQAQNLTSGATIYEEILSVKQYVLDMEERLKEMEAGMASVSKDELNAYMDTYHRLSENFARENGYAVRSEVTGVLKGLGFKDEDFSLQVDTLSGGQKTRVSLAKLLLEQPDILLLDEPTNHLDMAAIEWLETYLLNYKGAVLIVAHDRYFLDRIVTKIVEIENAKVTVFSGNYSDYASKKAILRNMQMKEYLNQQREIKHQEAVITKLKQFNREKSIKRAESREKMLEKTQLIDKPIELDDRMDIHLEPGIESGNDVLMVENLSKSFDEQLFSDITFTIRKGERVALIGDNGTGKTTMLKIINGLTPADNGMVRLGTNVTIGYYDQEHHVLDPDKSIFQEIQDTYPDMNNTKIRKTLAAFLFTGDDVFKLIRNLSGGEKGRVSLAKLMLSNANLLLLDEPTNHLDMTSKEILGNALNSYTGTVFYVSHDRYFINTTATRILHLSHRQVTNYIGNYDYYLEKRDILEHPEETEIVSESSAISSPAVSNGRETYHLSREEQKEERKRRKELEKCETKIAELEDEQTKIQEEQASPEVCSNQSKLMRLHERYEEISSELEGLYEIWEELSET